MPIDSTDVGCFGEDSEAQQMQQTPPAEGICWACCGRKYRGIKNHTRVSMNVVAQI